MLGDNMAPLPRGLLRLTIFSCILLAALCLLPLFNDKIDGQRVLNRAMSPQYILFDEPQGSNYDHSERLGLTEKQCQSTFPLLFSDIERSKARGRFRFAKSPKDYKGLVQGRIREGKLYLLTASGDSLPEILHQRTAILSQIHRALITSPTPLPDTYFAFAINDVPKNNSWAFSHPNKDSTYNSWLMPAFASWSWAKPHLGTTDEILARIEEVEKGMSWDDKIDKVVWRGTPWFNPLGHPHLRQDLLKATAGHDWADVEALKPGANSNRIELEDFCRYKYVMYTEGVTYSGRLPFHQACGSLTLMAPVTWVTASALLLRPITAEDLMRGSGRVGVDTGSNGREIKGIVVPTVASWSEANAIYLKPDFSDLEAVIQFLREQPDIARRIAQNQRELMIKGGYLSMPAELCYWRALIRAWAETVEVDDEEWKDEEEVRFETWLLKEVSQNRISARGRNNQAGT